MAITNTDLLLVQRGAVPHKAEASVLSTYIKGDIEGSDINIASAAELGVIRVGNNLSIDVNGVLSADLPAGTSYEGLWTDTDTAPASPSTGQFWIWDGGNGAVLNNALGWGAANGSTVNNGDTLMYNGTQFDIIPGSGGGGVQTITGVAPIVVAGDASTPEISITAATDAAAGSMSAADKLKLDGIAAGAEPNTIEDLDYVQSATGGQITISGGGQSADIPLATNAIAGLMSPGDKDELADLVANGSGVTSVGAGTGINVDSANAAAPVVSVAFGSTPNGTPATVMPYDISVLSELA